MQRFEIGINLLLATSCSCGYGGTVHTIMTSIIECNVHEVVAWPITLDWGPEQQWILFPF